MIITTKALKHLHEKCGRMSNNALYLYISRITKKAKKLNDPFIYKIRDIVDDIQSNGGKMGRITVTKAIRELVKYGLISKDRVSHRVIFYRVVM